jgi:hypothetical protein
MYSKFRPQIAPKVSPAVAAVKELRSRRVERLLRIYCLRRLPLDRVKQQVYIDFMLLDGFIRLEEIHRTVYLESDSRRHEHQSRQELMGIITAIRDGKYAKTGQQNTTKHNKTQHSSDFSLERARHFNDLRRELSQKRCAISPIFVALKPQSRG